MASQPTFRTLSANAIPNHTVPAALVSSRRELEEKLALFASIPEVERVQIDVVDGRFAKPASWPYTALRELQEKIKEGDMLPALDRIAYEIDLMCIDAETAAAPWLALGATRLTLHAESAMDLTRFLEFVRNAYGHFVTLGFALNVTTDASLIERHLDDIAYVQFMGISQIGQQGKTFDTRVLEKIRLFHKRYPDLPIQVDGGVTLENANKILAAGASDLVVGSGILKAKDPAAAFAKFESLQSPFGV